MKDLPNAVLNIFGIRTESEARYAIIEKQGPYEIRDVAGHHELSTMASGTRAGAANVSFDKLLQFIKGNNKSQQKYAMSSPVWQEKTGLEWQTTFLINSDGPPPPPNDAALHLHFRPAARIAIYRFSGRAADADVAHALNKLREWLKARGSVESGPPRFAQFDPPFAIPFLRRNEIQIPISK